MNFKISLDAAVKGNEQFRTPEHRKKCSENKLFNLFVTTHNTIFKDPKVIFKKLNLSFKISLNAAVKGNEQFRTPEHRKKVIKK